MVVMTASASNVAGWAAMRPTLLSPQTALSLPRLSIGENLAAAAIAALPIFPARWPIPSLVAARSPLALASALASMTLRWLLAFWVLKTVQKLRRQSSNLVTERR